MNAPVDVPRLVAGLAPLEITSLLRRSYALKPGDPFPGYSTNPAVSGVQERAIKRDVEQFMATHRWSPVQTLGEIAAVMGVPVKVPNIVHEIDLLNAQAVLRGALLDRTYVEWLYRGRTQGTPVNEATIRAAVKLVTDAEAAALALEVQQAERKF